MRTVEKTTTYGWPFTIAAILILIFAMGVVWWQAILVSLLAAFHVKVTTKETYR